MNDLISSWLASNPTCDCAPLHSNRQRTRQLAHVVDISSIPKSFRFDLTADIIIQFSNYARANRIGFGWWILPSSLATAFYR